MNFKHATSTAQEIAYSEENACEAAKDATDLSNPQIFLKEGSTRAKVTPFRSIQRKEDIKYLSNSRIT